MWFEPSHTHIPVMAPHRMEGGGGAGRGDGGAGRGDGGAGRGICLDLLHVVWIVCLLVWIFFVSGLCSISELSLVCKSMLQWSNKLK